MAYGEKYTFRFDSQEGKDWMVVIFEEGYTGTPVSRCVGGHPLLRMESNGCIRGMSLELPAECVVADEYADLYTSDPVRFKVSVYLDHDEVWQGFITPELYSAPWVDPPHDVALTATDGLGELKRQNYARGGRMSLATHLGNLLAATGLTLPIRMVSSLESDVNEPEDFLTGTLINLDHLSGETMYDALQAILASIHATVRQSGGSWLLIRETDISGSSAGSEVDDTEGDPIPVVPFGSMRTSDVWPVGRLTSEIVPARNSVTVTSDNESDREFLDDPDMTEGSWDGDATHSSDDGGYYQMAVGESISQEVTMPEMPSTTVEVPDMRLKVTARQADTAKAHNIRIKVSSYMYLAVSDRHETYWLSENSSGELVWTDVDGYLDREIPAAAVSRSTDCTSIEIIIPVTRHSQREERKIPETVTVEFASDDNTVYVHAASLGIIPQWAGIETRVTIDNGARGGDSPVGVMFADSEAYNRGLTWMSNCAYGLGTDIVPIHTLASGSITAAGTGVFLAQDYAMSVANPRLSLKGVLQIPSGAPIPVFLSTDGVVFIAEEWSYDLLTDELDVSMLSLPAVEIEVEDVTQESYSEKGGGGERASASSGGSAPSTPQARTLDWFIAETYTEDNTTKQRLRLNPKYQGMYADGWVSAGGVGTGGGGGGGDYLPLAGGTMSGTINMPAGSSTTSGPILRFRHESGGSQVFDAYVGANNAGTMALYAANDIRLRPGNSSSHGLIITTTDITYNGVSIKPRFFYGTSSSSGNTRTVTASGFTSSNLTAGTVLVVQMGISSDTNSNVTINVNSTGAKYIYSPAGYKSWKAGENVLFVYTSSGDWAMQPTYEYIIQHVSGGGGTVVSGVSTVVGRSGDVTVTHIADALTGAGYNLSAYTLPAATSGALGGIRLGYTQSGKNYPVLLDGSNRAYVNVPWQSGSGGSTVSVAQGAITSATYGTAVGTITVDGTGTTLYAPKVTVTQIQATGVEVARIKVGSANAVSIYAPSGGSGESGVQTVVGKTGDVTTTDIANALTNAGYKLTDTVPDLSNYVTTQALNTALSGYATTQSLNSYLPLSAGSGKALTGTLYASTIRPSTNPTSQYTDYDLGASTAFWKNTYTRRVYLADGIYVYYDETNNCIRTNAPIVSDSYISAGGVQST